MIFEKETVMVGIGNRWFEPPPEVAHVFVDLSNIYAGAQDAAKARHEYSPDVRLQAENVLDLLARGRATGTRLVVANSAVPEAVLRRFRGSGFEVETRELGHRSHTEQANDELLQVRMLRAITAGDQPPGALVLATGDGNGWMRERGFCPIVERAHHLNWKVEVASWRASLNARLSQVVTSASGRVVLLDDGYYGITFVEGGRRAQPIIHYPEAPAA
jgi:hypothetical protein